MNGTGIDTVSANGDVMESLLGARCSQQFIESGLKEVEWVACHLVGNSDESGSEGRANASLARCGLMPFLVNRQAGARVRVSNSIRHAASVLHQALETGRQHLLVGVEKESNRVVSYIVYCVIKDRRRNCSDGRTI